ncbi:proline dehydrogenase family protein [Gephyromycinifex aptenodytis]|uniref:proline dehydrogenase family protein n=1 Tax=Gephyromycinifex aptenodytis TaxID=2716227 RepID=UPI00144722A3|nr:proline dehydrogenase family protein [Gephyromycinifex aptenodytis]
MPVLRSVTQDLLLKMAGDTRLRRAVETPSMSHEIVRRYVAGESVSSAMDVASWLVARGRLVSLTHLASDPHDALAARDRRKRVRKVIRRLGDAGLTGQGRADVSVRLSALGGAMGPSGPALALEHMRSLAEAAAAAQVSLTLEAERDVPVETTIAAVHQLREDFPDTGISLQACLLRTEQDCRDLVGTGARVRLTKGAAAPDPAVYAGRHDVDLAYVRCLRTLLAGPDPVAVATHDERLLEIAQTLARRNGRDSSNLEYQLRYGVHPEMQAVLCDRGDRLRVYVPFGEEWYPYILRRVADSPSEMIALARASTSR